MTRTYTRGFLLVVLALSLLAGQAHGLPSGSVPMPDSDPFYAPPAGFVDAAPGTILRSRQVAVQGVYQASSTNAYQLLYRTRDATGEPIATVTTILLPSTPTAGPSKLVSFQATEDSLTTACAPSYQLRTGSAEGNYGSDANTIERLLQRGWVVVVPDYEGPRSEFSVGPLEGVTTLDSIRAAEAFAPAVSTERERPPH